VLGAGSRLGVGVGIAAGAFGKSKVCAFGEEGSDDSGVVKGERLKRSSAGQLPSWRSSSAWTALAKSKFCCAISMRRPFQPGGE